MPNFDISIAVSDRVAALINDAHTHRASMESLGSLSVRDWFAQEVKELARTTAMNEYLRQKRKGDIADRELIRGEVT